MEDYKSVLQVSAKPEKFVACYLAVVSIFSVSTLIWLVTYQWYVIIFVCISYYYIRKAWQTYYCLEAPKSIVSITIDHDDSIFVTYHDGEYSSVKRIDQLHLGRWILLFFVKAMPEKSKTEQIMNKEQQSLVSKIYNFPMATYQECCLFLNYRKNIFAVSENTIGKPIYRELLRRLKSD